MSESRKDPSQRILDLLALLLSTRRPVSRAEIYRELAEHYDGSEQARERKFTRDKAELEALGIQLQWSPPGEDEEEGYRVDRSTFFLPDIAFTPGERAALYAVGAAAMGAGFPLRTELARALAKLRSGSTEADEGARATIYTAASIAGPKEALVTRAVAERRKLRIVYPPESEVRVVDAYAAPVRRGRMALVGFCHLRGAIRTFYTDRMTACELASPKGKPPEFDVPADFEVAEHLPRHAWQLRAHPPLRVELEFAPELAESGPKALGFAPGQVPEVTCLDALINQVLALGPGVTLRGPPQARERMRARLEQLQQTVEVER